MAESVSSIALRCAFPDDCAFDLQGRDGLIGIVADQFGILFKLADAAAGIESKLDFARFAWFEHLVTRHFDATAGRCELAHVQGTFSGVFEFENGNGHIAFLHFPKIDEGFCQAQVGCTAFVRRIELFVDFCADIQVLHRAFGIVGGEVDVVECKSPVLFEARDIGHPQGERVSGRQRRFGHFRLQMARHFAAGLAELDRLFALVVENGRLGDRVVDKNGSVGQVIGFEANGTFFEGIEIHRPAHARRNFAVYREADKLRRTIGFHQNFLVEHSWPAHRIVFDLDLALSTAQNGIPAENRRRTSAGSLGRQHFQRFCSFVGEFEDGSDQAIFFLDFPEIVSRFLKFDVALTESRQGSQHHHNQDSYPNAENAGLNCQIHHGSKLVQKLEFGQWREGRQFQVIQNIRSFMIVFKRCTGKCRIFANLPTAVHGIFAMGIE
ncbi:MAG: hypothetical protein RLZZ519_560 [Bacteroidota bacterium]